MREIAVDLAAIASNYQKIKQLTGTQVMAIVKADAFGHGMIEVSKKLESIGVDLLGVADFDEALELRKEGINSNIMAWLHGTGSDFESALAARIEIGLASIDHLDKVAAAAKKLGSVAKLHLKVDTGLGRNGAALENWPELVSKAVGYRDQGLVELAGVFSHLSGTSEQEDLGQLEVFEQQIAIARTLGAEFGLRHLAASLAALSYPSTRLDMVRVGLALYGLDPSDSVSAAQFGLVPAMRVSAEVVMTKSVPAGHGVSYGFLHKTTAPSTLALVPFGYGEGLPRSATGSAEVLLNGKRYPILARVAMDQFVLDIGSDSCEVGDEVVIFGDAGRGEPSAEELAKACGTINYEIVTRIGGRAKRVYR
jgi:alanine racemase